MNDHDHDDGLVHGHGWATDVLAPSPAATPRPVAAIAVPTSGDDHDDGLVHEHGWACSERGRPAASA